jgi:hypothetical protein
MLGILGHIFFSIFNIDVQNNESSFYIGLGLYSIGLILLFCNIAMVVWPKKIYHYNFQENLYQRLEPLILVLLRNLQEAGYDLIYDENFFWLQIKKQKPGYLNI